MKVAIISGTPRSNGYTSELIKNLSAGLKNAGCEVKTVTLFDKVISGCNNCGVCQKKGNEGKCTIADDMRPIFTVVDDSELLIIASPIYMWQFTACTKAFLERLHCMYDSLDGKRIALAMTMGDDEMWPPMRSAHAGHVRILPHDLPNVVRQSPMPDKDEVNRPLYAEN